MKLIPNDILAKAIPFNTYFEQVQTYAATNTTSGPDQTESLNEYTRLNASRMRRMKKSIVLSPAVIDQINRIPFRMNWIIITEAWCGDSAQIIPYLAKLAESSERVSLGFVYRNENPDFMHQHLTNGSASIPKLIAYHSETGVELFSWGPRPTEAQTIIISNKAKGNDAEPYDVINEKLHRWYLNDSNKSIANELIGILQTLTN